MHHGPDDHTRLLPHLDVGVFCVLVDDDAGRDLGPIAPTKAGVGARRMPAACLLRGWIALVGASLLVACAGAPEAVVPELEAALRSGDRAAVEALLTEESRGLLATMLDAPHPEGRWPLGLHAPAEPSHVVAATPTGTGIVTLEVEDAGGKSEWIVRMESGRWRIDLIASSSRRAVWGM